MRKTLFSFFDQENKSESRKKHTFRFKITLISSLQQLYCLPRSYFNIHTKKYQISI